MNWGDIALVTGGPFMFTVGRVVDGGNGRSAVLLDVIEVPAYAPLPVHPSRSTIGVAPSDLVTVPGDLWAEIEGAA